MAKPLLRSAVLTASVDETHGTDESVPYEDAPKTQQRTNVWRGTQGFAGSLDTGIPQYMYLYNVNAPLKKRHLKNVFA